MADIELVIKIPEEEYQNYLNMRPAYPEGVFCYIKAIQNGIPLPKGHGRLIDADAFSGDMFCDADMTNQHTCYYSIRKLLDVAPTIIEADREEIGG